MWTLTCGLVCCADCWQGFLFVPILVFFIYAIAVTLVVFIRLAIVSAAAATCRREHGAGSVMLTDDYALCTCACLGSRKCVQDPFASV